MNDYRETIWGISPSDRKWFQVLTLLGGTSGSVILTVLELSHRSPGAAPNEVALNILLGIGASFVASGFVSWGLLQAKELTMSMADWIREQTRKHRERLLEEGRQQGRKEAREEAREEGRIQGREEVLREIYGPDYSESQEMNPPQPPNVGNINGTDE